MKRSLATLTTGVDKDIKIRLAIFAIGFSPIGSLCLSTFNLVPLYISGPAVVLPSIVAALIIGSVYPRYAQTLVRGFFLGLISVFLYDATCRFPFMAAGLWADFIPKIGSYLLRRDHMHWFVGYLWRYAGNGGGMGMAFYAIYPLISERVRPLKAGVTYGIGIFCCLLITVYCSPAGKVYLFSPTVMTATLGFLGHVVYGYCLGYGVKQLPDRQTTFAPATFSIRDTLIQAREGKAA